MRADRKPLQRWTHRHSLAGWGLPVLATALAGAAGAHDATNSAVAGQVLTLAGDCTSASDGADNWLALSAGATVAAGQRMRCLQGAEIRLRLPGSGTELSVRVRPGQEYVVPMGRLGPTPATETRPGREASVGPQMLAPGAAPGGAVVLADSGIARCAAPLGTIAFTDDPTSTSSQQASARGLEPPAVLLRRFAQESNCFVVDEGRLALSNALRESALVGARPADTPSASGSSARSARPAPRPPEGSQGRLLATDFVMVSRIDFAGGGRAQGGLLGSMSSGVGALAGTIASGTKPTSNLALVDLRSGVQVGAAEGRADAVDSAALQRWLASAPDGAGARYAQSAEGTLAAAALAASFNQLVQQTAILQGKTVGGVTAGAAKAAPAASAPPKPQLVEPAPKNDPPRAPP